MDDTLSRRIRVEILILTHVLRTPTALSQVFWKIEKQIIGMSKDWFMGRIDFLAHHRLLSLKLPKHPPQDHISGIRAKKIGQIPNDEKGKRKKLMQIREKKKSP